MVWDEVERIVILLNDISHQETIWALDIANKNKDKVIASFSHELRTPINGILGINRILKGSLTKLEDLNLLDLIQNNAYVLLDIVNSILDLQSIRQENFKLEI
mmetsp:Transcript_8983/g.7919  ORF Transcript_8983/g.7919 Transcript_8983/m.7919 type:complete len:103 (+) Transcript_8983:182-490(+)